MRMPSHQRNREVLLTLKLILKQMDAANSDVLYGSSRIRRETEAGEKN
jgi:hypothetical protein